MSYQKKDKSHTSAGAAEKSHKVHYRNYKIGVILQKQIQSLNVEEKNTACSIAVDQRIVTTRFRNKLNRSFDLMKHHDRIRARFSPKHQDPDGDEDLEQSKIEDVEVERKPSVASSGAGATKISRTDRRDKVKSDFNLKTFYDSSFLKNRPRTAVECRAKQWIRNADNANERVVRAKSAPAKSWRNCSDILRILDTSGGGNKAMKNQRPLSREKFFGSFDLEAFRNFRAEEVERQSEDVQHFVETLHPLKLQPWCPGCPAADRTSPKSVNKVQRTCSAFVTKVDHRF